MGSFYIDQDRLLSSIKIQVSGAFRNNISREKIANFVIGTYAGIEPQHLRSIFKQEKPDVYFITFHDDIDIGDFISPGHVDTIDMSAEVSFCSAVKQVAKVHWLPSWITDDAVVSLFPKPLTVTLVERETIHMKGGFKVETGVRKVHLVFKDGEEAVIPYKGRVSGKTGLITVPGRPPICLKCNNIGHVRSECPADFRKPPPRKALFSEITKGNTQKPVNIDTSLDTETGDQENQNNPDKDTQDTQDTKDAEATPIPSDNVTQTGSEEMEADTARTKRRLSDVEDEDPAPSEWSVVPFKRTLSLPIGCSLTPAQHT